VNETNQILAWDEAHFWAKPRETRKLFEVIERPPVCDRISEGNLVVTVSNDVNFMFFWKKVTNRRNILC